jgi:PrtD family type I secretion system ABC transporter
MQYSRMFNGSPRETLSLSLGRAIASFKSAFVGTALMSGMINILALTGSFFMLQIYDRVIPSHSVPTLLGLCLVAGLLFIFQGFLEFFRARILSRIALALDERLHGRVYKALIGLPLRSRTPGDGLQPLRDLDQVRSFLASNGPSALFDLPWMPLYLGICFAFHFWIGVTALSGAILLVSLTLLTEMMTREPTKSAGALASSRNAVAEFSLRNAEVLQAMGFGHRMAARWELVNRRFLSAHSKASDAAAAIGACSRVARVALQSLLLAVGAYLVIEREATGGIMIASSIMMGRALSPIELSIANWKGFVGARQAWRRLVELLASAPVEAPATALPAPHMSLQVAGVAVVPPGEKRAVVQDAEFVLRAGDALGVIGPSASGKSSLSRAIVGVWPPVRGNVRLDGATFEQWRSEDIGRHVGYLPQSVELFDGTVGENISRFEPNAPSEMVLAAAGAAGVHDLIVNLPEGYETQIGEGGKALSAGQRQRIGLARALYGNPFLVVLDEPNSNLDAEGELALTQAIASVRERKGIIIVVAHRPSVLLGVDQLLVMANGRMEAFGPKDEVLRKVIQPAPLHSVPSHSAGSATVPAHAHSSHSANSPRPPLRPQWSPPFGAGAFRGKAAAPVPQSRVE